MNAEKFSNLAEKALDQFAKEENVFKARSLWAEFTFWNNKLKQEVGDDIDE